MNKTTGRKSKKKLNLNNTVNQLCPIWQRMFKLPHNCTHLTCKQSSTHNSPSEASVVCESRSSRCSSWIYKRKRKQRSNCSICWIINKAKEFQKNICFCFIDYTEAFSCVDHNKLWKILKGMGIPGHLTCLLRNIYTGQEATVRSGHGTTDWFQIGRGVRQGCILSPCLFNLNAEYIMRNTGLEEAQAGIKIAREKYQ